jgi:hypothetical protein
MACLLASFWLFLVRLGMLLVFSRVLRSELFTGLGISRMMSSGSS